jgi:hypothetical protein
MDKVKNIALVSSYVPFIDGGAMNIVNWLAKKLESKGFNVDIVWIPEDHSPDKILSQIKLYELLDLSDADLVITFRPMSHLVKHRNKIIWFIHHVRSFYDLWGTESHSGFRTRENQKIRETLMSIDTVALNTSNRIFTNSLEVQSRLSKFNGVRSEVLYPPLLDPGVYKFESQNNQQSYKDIPIHNTQNALGSSDYLQNLQARIVKDNQKMMQNNFFSSLNQNNSSALE